MREVPVRLERILGALLTDVGGDAVRMVDAHTGSVVAAVGPDPADDVTTLLAGAGEAPPKAGDLVIAAHGEVHVLRGIAALLVDVRLGHDADVAAARRALADPGLHAALCRDARDRDARDRDPGGRVARDRVARDRDARGRDARDQDTRDRDAPGNAPRVGDGLRVPWQRRSSGPGDPTPPVAAAGAARRTGTGAPAPPPTAADAGPAPGSRVGPGAGPRPAGPDGPLPDHAAGPEVAPRVPEPPTAVVAQQPATVGGPPAEEATVGEATVGEATVGEAAVGEAAVGEAAVGEAAVGEAAVGEAAVGEAAGEAPVVVPAPGEVTAGELTVVVPAAEAPTAAVPAAAVPLAADPRPVPGFLLGVPGTGAAGQRYAATLAQRTPGGSATLAVAAEGALPALARIGARTTQESFGALAVTALGTDEATRLSATTWSRDLATMNRLLTALRRL